MSVQTGLAPPNTDRAKLVCADIRTTSCAMWSVNVVYSVDYGLVWLVDTKILTTLALKEDTAFVR